MQGWGAAGRPTQYPCREVMWWVFPLSPGKAISSHVQWEESFIYSQRGSEHPPLQVLALGLCRSLRLSQGGSRAELYSGGVCDALAHVFLVSTCKVIPLCYDLNVCVPAKCIC